MQWDTVKSYIYAVFIHFIRPTMLKSAQSVLKSAILAVFSAQSGISRKKPDILAVGPARQA
jgi:hypothetical protein